MIDFAHMVFGLALAYLLRFPVVWAMIGAVLPDVDILFEAAYPFVHRGIMHTPLAIGFFMVVLFLATARSAPAFALGLGMLTHLYLDTFTYSGIMWGYPLTDTAYTLELVGYDHAIMNIGIVALSAASVLGFRYWEEVRLWIR